MIRYALNCDEGHGFESWFQNSAAYDKQVKRSLVNCPVCGSTKVEKAMMAPSMASSSASNLADAADPPSLSPASANPAPPLSFNLPSIVSGGGIGRGQPPIPPKNPVAMVSPP